MVLKRALTIPVGMFALCSLLLVFEWLAIKLVKCVVADMLLSMSIRILLGNKML